VPSSGCGRVRDYLITLLIQTYVSFRSGSKRKQFGISILSQSFPYAGLLEARPYFSAYTAFGLHCGSCYRMFQENQVFEIILTHFWPFHMAGYTVAAPQKVT